MTSSYAKVAICGLPQPACSAQSSIKIIQGNKSLMRGAKHTEMVNQRNNSLRLWIRFFLDFSTFPLYSRSKFPD